MAKTPNPYDAYTDEPVSETTPPAPVAALFDALMHRALDVGTERIASKMREASGQLSPVSLILTGLVVDAPEPGMFELQVALPGARPVTLKVPYAAPGANVPPHAHFQAQQLRGHAVKIKIDIAR